MHLPPYKARVIEVVFVDAHFGDGSPQNPERLVHMYFSREGALLACHDPDLGPPDAFRGRGYVVGGEDYPLPESFVSASWRKTILHKSGERLGLSFDLGSGRVVRLDLSTESARMLMASLRSYLGAEERSPLQGDDVQASAA